MIEPPRAPRRPRLRRRHGHVRSDPYAWLRDRDWRRVMREPEALDPRIRTYLEAENAYAEAVLAPLAGLRRKLIAELRGRIKEDDSAPPAPDGPYAYYHRFAPGGQHPVLCRRAGRGKGSEEVLLDGDAEGAGQTFFRLAGARHAPDHRLLAHAVDLNGSESLTIRFRDLATGADLPDRLTGAHGDMAWAADGRTLLYTVLDDDHRPSRVLAHRIGTSPERDIAVYREPDSGFYVNVARTESGRFIAITSHDHQTTEVRLVDAARPEALPRLVAAREPSVRYEVGHRDDRLVILTNAGDAEDFAVVTAPIEDAGRSRWRTLIAHRPGRLIRRILVFARWLVRLEREDGLPRIVVREMVRGEEHTIAFDEEAYELDLVPGYEFETDVLRFSYASMTTPQRIFDYDMAARTRTLVKEQEIPSGHDPSAYVARRLEAPGHDGAKVPVSVLHRRDLAGAGAPPALLYGYGAYGFAMPAGFAANRFSLVDRGFVYAIAHVRGGTECGYGWYRAGKLAAKMNTFLDFIAAAEHLAARGLARPGAIAAHGASAGGLLMGAVANMRPDLFRAIVAEVPFVDALTTMLDRRLPLTPPEWTEWGNPIADAEAYRTLLAYSPYDNVRAQDYPHMLVTAGLTDPRVTYWEPAKWVARLRALKTDRNLLLLRTNMGAGHAGAPGRFDRLEEVALIQAFVLMTFGRADEGG